MSAKRGSVVLLVLLSITACGGGGGGGGGGGTNPPPDTTAPNTTISSNPVDPTNEVDAEFTFTSTETGSTFECSIDGAAYTTCTSPANYTGLAEGNHTFEVRAIDAAGNIDATPASYNWEIDITPPDTTLDSTPDNPTNVVNANFEFSSSEAGSTFQCTIDGGPLSNCTSPETYTGLTEGIHSLDVRATDAAGNTDATPATYSWTVDLTPPVITAPPPISVGTAGGGIAVSHPAIQAFLDAATAADAVDGDLSAAITHDAPATFPVGITTVTFSATDAAGNTGSSSSTVDVFVADLVAPNTTTITINNDNVYAVSISEFTARLTALDNIGVTGYLITEHNATDPMNVVPTYLDPLISDPRWVSVSATTTFDLTIQFPISGSHTVGDTVELCVWFQDAAGNISTRVCDSIIYVVDWESGIGFWSADNGVWQTGTPTAGPASCFSGSQCAGTILDGNYPVSTDSRLVSPSIQLPNVAGTDEIHLRFQQWSSYGGGDAGRVDISVFDPATLTWGAWVTEGALVGGVSGVWSLKDVDLTAYSGQRIRVGLLHASDGFQTVSTGWYVDDINIVQTSPTFTGDFESNWDGWGAENGVWQVGTPTVGPISCFSGSQCAGTVLGGSYPVSTDSRLVSSSTQLPTVAGTDEIHLRFQHWSSYGGGDAGRVDISVWDSATSTWGAWVTEGALVGGVSAVWSLKDVDLTAYSGQRIRIGFQHGSDGFQTVSTGWYIDDITIVQNSPAITGDFENGWDDWGAENGVWQIGTPTVGPAGCFSGSQCAGTILGGNYPVSTDSRLVSSSTQLPTVAGTDEIHLRFQHWSSYGGGDAGRVDVSAWDPATSTWGAWVTEGELVGGVSGVWSLKNVDLTAYSGQRVRIGLFHASDGFQTVNTGWYIDNLRIVQTSPAFTGDFETGWDGWGAENGVWEIGTPTVGPAGCFSGSQCAGTILGGNYPVSTDSRLVSSSTQLPTVTGAEEVHLRFQQWFSYGAGDAGRVDVSVWDPATSTWGAWVTEGTLVGGVSGVWSLKDVNLTAYSGSRVRIGLFHASDGFQTVSTGWFVDDLEFSVF